MRPDEDWEERLPHLLASYDESVEVGRASSATDDAVPVEVRLRLERMQACLDRLEKDRLRSGQPPSDGPATPPDGEGVGSTDFAAPPQLGRFRVLRMLGAGGFGVVYLAEDPRLGRRVAVKVPRPEALVTPDLRRRFLREARAAARLHHTNIVPIFDVGEVGPLCYMVSAFCSGGTLAAWLKNRTSLVPLRSAAHVIAVLADAVQHAHDRGILHRDLKPGNVLLRPEESASALGQDGIGFTPLIADFGLAKFVDLASEFSSTSPIPQLEAAPSGDAGFSHAMTRGPAGTPEYMAPEQTADHHEDVDRPADVYALGCILYQLLTGTPPFTGGGPELMRQVREDEPLSPRSLRARVPRDLETVCLKCLRKKPAERYATARDLAEDLRRWLAGEPVQSRPAGPLRRLAKWGGRRPAAAGLVALSIATLLGLLGATFWYASAVGHEEFHQRRQTYVQQIREAQQVLDDGDFHGLTELMNGLRPPPGARDLRSFEWHYLWRRYQEAGLWLSGHENTVTGLAFSPDGQTLFSSGREGAFRLWDARTGHARARVHSSAGSISHLVASRDAATMATLNQDRTVSLWNAAGQLDATLADFAGMEGALAIAQDGETLAAGARDRTLLLWDTRTRQIRARLEYGHDIRAVGFAPEGKVVAFGSSGPIRIWDLQAGQKVKDVANPGHQVVSLAFSLDGQLAVTGGDANEVVLWDTSSWTVRARLAGPGGPLIVAFSPDGRELAVCSTRSFPEPRIVAQLWNVADALNAPNVPARPVATFTLSDRCVAAVAFAPDGRMIALGCTDHITRLWRPVRGMDRPAPMTHGSDEAWAVAFSPDGKLLASAGDNVKGPDCLRVWDAQTGKLCWAAAAHTQLVSCVAFAPDGTLLASGGYDNAVKLWDPVTGHPRLSLNAHGAALRCLAFSADGRWLASGDKDSNTHLWEVGSEQPLRTFRGDGGQVRGIAFSPDSRNLVIGDTGQLVRFWEIDTGRELESHRTRSPVQCVACAPGGKSVAWGMQDGELKWLDVSTGLARSFSGRHPGEIRSLAFSPDGRRLATAGSDGTVRLWDTETLSQLLALRAGSMPINSVAFSPAGDSLATAGHDGAVRIWHAPKDE